MDQTAPYIHDIPQGELYKYLSSNLIYVDYYPVTERTGDFPIPSFAYISWDGRPSAMPSVNQKVRFRYMMDGKYYVGTIDPAKRRFISSEMRNHGLSSEYVYSSKMGPFIEIENPPTGPIPAKKMYIAFYEKPRALVYDVSPASRTDQVYKHGAGILFDHITLILILILLILTFSLIYGTNPHLFEVAKVGELGLLALG